MTSSIHPYLNFTAETAEALSFYQSIFGGELQILTFGMARAVPEGDPAEKLAMHAELRTPYATLMASDAPEALAPSAVVRGNDMHLSVVTDDEEQGRTWFEALAQGGTITMPFERQMSGDLFGMIRDRFGIQWMVNVRPQA